MDGVVGRFQWDNPVTILVYLVYIGKSPMLSESRIHQLRWDESDREIFTLLRGGIARSDMCTRAAKESYCAIVSKIYFSGKTRGRNRSAKWENILSYNA